MNRLKEDPVHSQKHRGQCATLAISTSYWETITAIDPVAAYVRSPDLVAKLPLNLEVLGHISALFGTRRPPADQYLSAEPAIFKLKMSRKSERSWEQLWGLRSNTLLLPCSGRCSWTTSCPSHWVTSTLWSSEANPYFQRIPSRCATLQGTP